ncbi:hypothetical protein J2X04_001686 [Lysobacter niabensis]|uniref:Uncharacterized protein n=1 Tax=Agrilutibacter niabensis TaxID=380628 RepID=A0ABU1VPC7_9GAMM|nr:hypothetical protein [Lysobacter niabensis]MDR7099339.1 hypothetical protein [Lysobacter niabensis]
MRPNVPAALEQLALAVLKLFEDANLAYADPGEPHVVSELFALLRPRFPDHTVSNEYDRREQEIKLLGDSKIIPDLVVHRVGHQADNLLVIEIKLAGNYDYENDIRKLRGMTENKGEYRYAVGVHLVLSVTRRRVMRGHVYIDGTVDPELTQWFEAKFA